MPTTTIGLTTVHAGFIPLLDCAPLVIAHELGFDRQFGITLRLHREGSWANIRDKLDIGVLDCAQMLAPMPLAATLGLGRPMQPVIAPMVLSLNGNAITVSNALFAEMQEANPQTASSVGMESAFALADVIHRRQQSGQELLTLGMVYPFSAHNYDLRSWLASAAVNPDADVNLVVVPPPLIANSLYAGRVDGFCVGAPWNSVSATAGDGVIVALKDDLWAASPEKVLGVGERWANDNPELLRKIIRALFTACLWLDRDENRDETARILAREEYVGVPESILLPLLNGTVFLGQGRTRQNADVVIFCRDDANMPDPSDAVWFLTQMIRWGHARQPFEIRGLAERVYRPDIFRAAVADVSQSQSSQSKVRRRYCGEAFDPRAPLSYLKNLLIKSDVIDLIALSRANAS